MALVIDGESPPLGTHGAVIDERDQRTGDHFPNPTGEDRNVLGDVIRLEPMTTGFMEKDSTASLLDHHGQGSRWRRSSRQLREGTLGSRPGQILDEEPVEQLETDGGAHRLAPGLQAGVATGHARNGEPGLHLIVAGQHTLAVGHQYAPAAVAVDGGHLADGTPGGAGGLVGPAQQRHLLRLGHTLRQDADVVGRGRCHPAQGHGPHSPTALAGGGGSSLRRGPQARFAQVARVGEAGGVAGDHPDARAAVATGRQILDPPVVEPGGRPAPILDEHLGELSAGPQRHAEDTLHHRFVDHVRSCLHWN